MDVIPRPCGQPLLHFRMLVRSIVVEDEMNIEISGDGVVYPLQKTEKLLMPVSRLAFAYYGPFQNVKAANKVVVP